jgi:hypothetical protein
MNHEYSRQWRGSRESEKGRIHIERMLKTMGATKRQRARPTFLVSRAKISLSTDIEAEKGVL